MYQVTITTNLGQAESYADALAIADKHRGNGFIRIQAWNEDSKRTVALITHGGKLIEPLQGLKPTYLGSQQDDITTP